MTLHSPTPIKELQCKYINQEVFVVNTLTPIFENCKQTEGVYDYLIVCDDRNNPASVIDQNELRVDIYLKPVRAAEFILVNFYAVNTDVNFEEIAGQ